MLNIINNEIIIKVDVYVYCLVEIVKMGFACMLGYWFGTRDKKNNG